MFQANLRVNLLKKYLLQIQLTRLSLPIHLALTFTLSASPLTWAQQEVIYPRGETAGDARQRYPVRLLDACAKHLTDTIIFTPSKLRMQQGRALKLLENKQSLIDIAWTLTSIEREQKLLPIRIPIDRGLIGWRLLLIHQQGQFSSINTLEQLTQLRAGQGHDWPDTPILRHNQLKVTINHTYTGLFEMLKRGHIDYFPRSLMEIKAEQQQHAAENITIEPQLALHYPAALYFFVSPHNPKLAQQLHQCLNTMIANGELQTLFNEYFLPDIQQANLHQRHIFTLHNPLLPPETPLEQSELWFSPAELTP